MSRTVGIWAWFGLAVWCAPAAAQFGGGMGGLGGGGIIVDADGVLRPATRAERTGKRPAPPTLSQEIAARSDLRQVSLLELDRQLRAALAAGKPIPVEVENLAGLVKIEYVLIDRERRDIRLAGPAGGWEMDASGRAMGRRGHRPVLNVADLAAALRCVLAGPAEVYCSIDPQRSGLAAVREVFDNLKVPNGRREAEQLRLRVMDLLDLQIITVRGVPEGSRFALVMIEADYRMKQMAMAQEHVSALPTHLDALVEATESGEYRPNLARWWFSPNYRPFLCNAERTVFKFQGQAVRLLNEEVLVDAQGNREGTGRTSPQGDQFSQAFTKRFPQLEERYPAFADLHNLFDLLMVAGLVRQQGAEGYLAGSALLDPKVYALPAAQQPQRAEPVASYRLHSRKDGRKRMNHVTIAFGGVSVRPAEVVTAESIVPDTTGAVAAVKLVPLEQTPSGPSKPAVPPSSETGKQPASVPPARFWVDAPIGDK